MCCCCPHVQIVDEKKYPWWPCPQYINNACVLCNHGSFVIVQDRR